MRLQDRRSFRLLLPPPTIEGDKQKCKIIHVVTPKVCSTSWVMWSDDVIRVAELQGKVENRTKAAEEGKYQLPSKELGLFLWRNRQSDTLSLSVSLFVCVYLLMVFVSCSRNQTSPASLVLKKETRQYSLSSPLLCLIYFFRTSIRNPPKSSSGVSMILFRPRTT